MHKQPEITDATRKNFFLAFGELYKQKPIENITVKEIAQKAGYSRTTFYNYFSSQYDLLNSLEDEFIAYLTDEIVANITKNQILDNFIFSFITVVNSQKSYGSILLFNPYGTQFIFRLKEKVMPILLDAFQIPPNNHQAVYTLDFYLSGIISLLSRWLKEEQEMPIEQVAQLIKAFLSKGILQQIGID